jgi:hypothetical protein
VTYLCQIFIFSHEECNGGMPSLTNGRFRNMAPESGRSGSGQIQNPSLSRHPRHSTLNPALRIRNLQRSRLKAFNNYIRAYSAGDDDYEVQKPQSFVFCDQPS